MIERTSIEPVKRMFVKEIEEALLDGRIDLAVHSSKDLPAVLPDGLRIGAALPREDPRDAIALPSTTRARGWDDVKAELGGGVAIGTSSVRRIAALRVAFPAATFSGDSRQRRHAPAQARRGRMRGPRAGRRRAEAARARRARSPRTIPVEVSVPAPGQGIIAIEISSDRRRRHSRCRVAPQRSGCRRRASTPSERSSRRLAADVSCRSACSRASRGRRSSSSAWSRHSMAAG